MERTELGDEESSKGSITYKRMQQMFRTIAMRWLLIAVITAAFVYFIWVGIYYAALQYTSSKESWLLERGSSIEFFEENKGFLKSRDISSEEISAYLFDDGDIEYARIVRYQFFGAHFTVLFGADGELVQVFPTGM